MVENSLAKLDVPIVKAIQDAAPNAKVSFAGNREEIAPFRAYSKSEIDEAVALAAKTDVAVVVVNQPAGEDWGDLSSLSLSNPSNQDALGAAVASTKPPTG